jgi:sugar/nucleoside kinase (ribokinase family)
MDSLLVCGNLNMDTILSVEYLPEEGQSTPVRSRRREFGGCGGNISIGASKLGVPVMLSAIIGNDFDPEYRKRLQGHDIDLEHLVVDEELPSPFCLVLSAPEGQQAYAFMEGAMGKQKDLEPPIPVKDPIGFCHIATSHPDFSKRTAAAMVDCGISTSFDPGQEIYFRWKGTEVEEVLKNCDRFFGNLGEWEYLMDTLDLDWEERSIPGVVYPWSGKIFDLIDEAVVTLGDKGSMLITKDRVIHQPILYVDEFKDATGAGDAFRGGFFAALLRGISSEEALLYGNAMGALSLTSAGPQGYKASWDKIEDMIKNR